MENFFNYISKPLKPEDVDLWFRVNNIIPEKMELFLDFTNSLNNLILDTYLGEGENKETQIILSEIDDRKHFEWCWNKILENFRKEKIFFNTFGEHFEYFESFFQETFYNQKDIKVKTSIGVFFVDLFDYDKSFTKSDLDMITTIYKLLDKEIDQQKYLQ
jgi:hypothetical protein